LFQDKANKSSENKINGGIQLMDKEQTIPSVKYGYILGELKHDDGRIETFEQHVDGDIMNLIVNRASLLVAQLMKDGTAGGGITYLAVGTGYGSGSGGTLQSPSSPLVGNIALENELTRKAVTVTYYDGAHAEPDTIYDSTRTNKLQIVCTFTNAEAVGALTEMALFGGTGASARDGGTIINRRTFPVWNKPNNASLTWTWILVF